MYPQHQVTISFIAAPFIAVLAVCLPGEKKKVQCFMAEMYLSQVHSSKASDHLHHSNVPFFSHLESMLKTTQVDKNQLIQDLQNSFSCQ